MVEGASACSCREKFFILFILFILFIYFISRFLPTADAHTSTSLHEAPREAPQHYRLPNLRYRCLSVNIKHCPNEVLLLPNEIHSTLFELQATDRFTLAGLLPPSCLIVVSLLGSVWNSGTAPASVYRCSNNVLERIVFKITSSSCYRVSCTEVVVYR